jgi:hypothetical protein
LTKHLLKKEALQRKPTGAQLPTIVRRLVHSFTPKFTGQLDPGQPGFARTQNQSTTSLWASPHAYASRGHPDAPVVIKRCFVDQGQGFEVMPAPGSSVI